jgi:hypothetical protein
MESEPDVSKVEAATPEVVSKSTIPDMRVNYLEGYRDGMNDMLMWFLTAIIALVIVRRIYGISEA